jgi:hypothetical protein
MQNKIFTGKTPKSLLYSDDKPALEKETSSSILPYPKVPKRKNIYMPNKDNVESLMKEFSDALSDRDKIFMVSMAQEDDEESAERAPKKDEK